MAHFIDWDSSVRQPKLELNDIHVWRVSLRSASINAKNLCEVLSNDEIDRARGFHFQRDQDRFISVHGVLRILLSAYIRLAPRQIRFKYSAHGRPSLAFDQDDSMLDFNVSHSHEWALLAFTRGGVVGVDLEYIRSDIAHEQIAEHFFSTQEIASLRAIPDGLRPAAFFNCWTRKEAFIKATGEGLSRPLDQFSMSLVPGEAARLLSIQGQPEELSNWLVQGLDLDSGYAGALVAQNPIKQIYCWKYMLS